MFLIDKFEIERDSWIRCVNMILINLHDIYEYSKRFFQRNSIETNKLTVD